MARMITACQGCHSRRLEPVLWLGYGVPANSMLKADEPMCPQTFYPLELVRCEDCTLVQLSCIVENTEIFHPDYPYSSGNSGQLRDHFDRLAESVTANSRLEPKDLVVDVGANDGTLVHAFRRLGVQTAAVEPTNQVAKVEGPCYQAYFDSSVAARIVDAQGFAKAVTACNVLAHVDNVHDALEGVASLLAEDGVLVAENHDLLSVVGGQWDTVYHEHLRYYDPYSFAELLRHHGLFVHRVDSVSTHGGSFRVYASKHESGSRSVARREYDFAWLRTRCAKTRAHLRAALSAQQGGQRVGAIGATARASTLIGYCGLDREDIEAVYEVDGSDKVGHFMAGTRIPVVSEARLQPHAPDLLVLFSWHLKDRIVPSLRLKFGGTILVPLPDLSYMRPRSL